MKNGKDKEKSEMKEVCSESPEVGFSPPPQKKKGSWQIKLVEIKMKIMVPAGLGGDECDRWISNVGGLGRRTKTEGGIGGGGLQENDQNPWSSGIVTSVVIEKSND